MDYFTFFQADSWIFSQDIPMVVKVLTYLITAVGGGVLYKYFNRWLSYSENQQSQTQKASDSLIENMEQRIKALNDRITDLEDKREESYERELNLTKMLAKAEQKVENLENKVELLERNQKVTEEALNKYYAKFGPLDEI